MTLARRFRSPLDEFFGDSMWLNHVTDRYGHWRSDEETFRFTLEIPGVPREDVRVTIDTEYNLLKVKVADNKLLTYSIPAKYRAEEVSANVEHGLLTVTFPRPTRRTREIEVL